MLDSFYISSIGMRAHSTQIDTISNNVANLNTTGFKRGIVSFSSLSATDGVRAAADAARVVAALGSLRGGGVATQLAYSMAAGALTPTNAPLDVAINGAGFIEVTRADGSPAYTRAGSLMINAQGMLATRNGEVLAAKIAVPPDAQTVSIAPDGHVYAITGNSATQVDLGQIDLVSFANPSGMQAAGGTLYVPGLDSGDPHSAAPNSDGLGTLQSGYLESSNVDMTAELTTLMLAQRGFELNSRVVQAADQMLQTVNSLYR
jgi:flagellar basal-body rod protein FlgG